MLTLSANSPTPSSISSFLLELDIHLPPDRDSVVVDHFNYDSLSSPEQHDVLILPRSTSLRPDSRKYFGGDGLVALPNGVAQELGNRSPLLASILRAKSTAYSYNPKDEIEIVEDPFAVGEQIALVSSMQARNSARFTVIGSVEALEDRWFDAKVRPLGGKDTNTINREFLKQISAWTFKEVGVLNVGKVEHHLSSRSEGAAGNDSMTQLGYLNPTIYRIKNDVVSWMTPHVLIVAKLQIRLSMLNCPSTLMITMRLSKSETVTLFNSNSRCSRPFTVSSSCPSPRLQTLRCLVVPSSCQTSMESFHFGSTTSDHSSRMLTSNARLRFDTLHMMSGLAAGKSVRDGYGLRVFGSRLPAG